jgi:hypothetical protein
VKTSGHEDHPFNTRQGSPRNQNKLDNQRRNLRTTTHSQNKGNCGLQLNNRSGFKGVGWHKFSNQWRATIRVNYRQKHLGYFPLTQAGKKAAAKAYNAAALEYFGEYAVLNEV